MRPWRKQNHMLRPREVANKRKQMNSRTLGRGGLSWTQTLFFGAYLSIAQICLNMQFTVQCSKGNLTYLCTLIKILELANSKQIKFTIASKHDFLSTLLVHMGQNRLILGLAVWIIFKVSSLIVNSPIPTPVFVEN